MSSTSPSELSRQITLIKGKRTTASIVKGADVSRETFRKIERGQSVKLDTLMAIADYLQASENQRTELIIAWIKLEVGEHSRRIKIINSRQSKAAPEDQDEIATILRQLSTADRQQFLQAMVRPEVRRALPALNQLHDSIKQRPAE